jgi:purine-binding chemotaxis protein CheW
MAETDARPELDILIFELGGQRYGLPALDVREIVRAVPPVPLPGAPAVVEGVINLHGKIVPVFDLRRRFRLPAKPPEHTDHLVIARAAGRLLALRVDRALDLARIAADDVEELRGLSGAERAARVAKRLDGLLVVYDLRDLLSTAESAELDEALPAGEGGRP